MPAPVSINLRFFTLLEMSALIRRKLLVVLNSLCTPSLERLNAAELGCLKPLLVHKIARVVSIAFS